MDVVLAWLVAEDDGARQKIQDELSKREETLEDLKKSLQGMTHIHTTSPPLPFPRPSKKKKISTSHKQRTSLRHPQSSTPNHLRRRRERRRISERDARDPSPMSLIKKNQHHPLLTKNKQEAEITYKKS